jgi:proliferating cell nuclear antigen
MDSSHVSLLALYLKKEGFDAYNIGRNLSLGMTIDSVAKVLKCAGNDDVITIRAEDSGDSVEFLFESESEHSPNRHSRPRKEEGMPGAR